MVPSSWTEELTEKITKVGDYGQSWGSFTQHWPTFTAGTILGTDGGCKLGNTDSRIRKTTWGIIHMDSNWCLAGFRWGTLVGSQYLQTVPRSELAALVEATQSHGDILVYSDSSYVVKGFNKGTGLEAQVTPGPVEASMGKL